MAGVARGGDDLSPISSISRFFLDSLFQRSNEPPPDDPPGDTLAKVQQSMNACFAITQERMQSLRDVYESESVWAAARYAVREDDILRLLFIGDLVTCLSKIDEDLSKRLLAGIQEDNILVAEEMTDSLFERDSQTPIAMTKLQHKALQGIIDEDWIFKNDKRRISSGQNFWQWCTCFFGGKYGSIKAVLFLLMLMTLIGFAHHTFGARRPTISNIKTGDQARSKNVVIGSLSPPHKKKGTRKKNK